MRYSRLRVSLAAALTVAACAGRTATLAPAPVASCEAGDSTMIRDVLYFGRNRPAGGVVSDAEWQGFLDGVVTPRFPAGLTVVSARGQWRAQNGVLEHEQAEVVTVFHADDKSAHQAIAEVMAVYKRRFQQEAVLRDRTRTCARFG